MSQTPRCSTGLERLDQALDGGIPRGNTVLVAGTSGAGKTTLALQFLCDGARRGERSAFISITEPTTMLRRNLAGYSFFKPEYLAAGNLTLLDLRAVALRMDMEDARFKADQYLTLVDTVQMLCREMGIKRLAIDSVTAIGEWLTDPVRMRDFLFRLGLALGSLQCTTLLTAETPLSATRPSAGTAEFVADGIILLHDGEGVKGAVRSLQVVKMRGSRHERTRLEMELSSDGIRLVADPQSRFAAPAPANVKEVTQEPAPLAEKAPAQADVSSSQPGGRESTSTSPSQNLSAEADLTPSQQEGAQELAPPAEKASAAEEVPPSQEGAQESGVPAEKVPPDGEVAASPEGTQESASPAQKVRTDEDATSSQDAPQH